MKGQPQACNLHSGVIHVINELTFAQNKTL